MDNVSHEVVDTATVLEPKQTRRTSLQKFLKGKRKSLQKLLMEKERQLILEKKSKDQNNQLTRASRN
jgi:hypothetical protein